MRDLAENITGLIPIRPGVRVADDEQNAIANGAHATAGEIDKADYGYPRKIMIIVTVGVVAAGGLLDIDIESGLTTGALTNTDASLNQMAAVGEQVYEYKPTRRFINIEATVTVNDVTYGIGLVMEHNRFGNRGADD